MKLKIFIPLLILMVELKLNAQEPSIIVHDYNPDVKIIKEGSDTLKIDFNKDGVLDLMFYLVVTSGGQFPTIKSLNNNCKLSLITETDSLIGQYMGFSSELTYLMGLFTSEKIGIRIIDNGKKHYGWVHSIFSMEKGHAIITIDKYAFCTIPDYPLLWGQTELTGIKEIKVRDKIKVLVDNQSQSINIQSKEVVKEISLINSSGRVIRKWENIKSSRVDIPSEGIKGGVYFLRIKTENYEVVNEKVVL